MPTLIFLTGGTRSGKSSYALKLAKEYSNPCFIATATPCDKEMEDRIQKHKADRGSAFITIEEPLNLTDAIEKAQDKAGIILLDCLTVWLGNLLYNFDDKAKIICEMEKFIEAVQNRIVPMIIVSNELGMGLVPESAGSRWFRDTAGYLNQKVARLADEFFFMVSGLPIGVKKSNQKQIYYSLQRKKNDNIL